jgi:hypothetical protein
MKIGIIGILNNPAKSLNSHSAGWNEVVRKLISDDAEILTEKDNWNNYEVLIINHGVNFKAGSFNVIGGISDQVYQRIEKLIQYKGNLFQIDGFQMKDFLEKRKINAYEFNSIIEKFEILDKPKLLIGDSHSISVYPGSNYNIERNDGKTLYGFLKNPKKADYYYFGNIDIRFHLCRLANPEQGTIDLVRRYIALAKENKAKVSCLLPIENEDRKMPGTGLYKGKPFYGSRELRSKLVELFNNELLSSGLEVNEWPKLWYNDINFFQKEVMEPKQSVHIRPKFYTNNITNDTSVSGLLF